MFLKKNAFCFKARNSNELCVECIHNIAFYRGFVVSAEDKWQTPEFN